MQDDPFTRIPKGNLEEDPIAPYLARVMHESILNPIPMKTNIPLFSPFFLLACLFLCTCPAFLQGQSPVTSFNASYITTASSVGNYPATPAGNQGAFSGCSAATYTYTFSNGTANQYKLNNFNANGSSWFLSPGTAGVVRLRRVNNANATGNRSILYMETTAASAVACPSGAALNFRPPYLDDMEELLNAGMLNQGTDNIFCNASNGDGNNNNIERVDVIFSAGLNTATPTKSGFVIFDRGNNYQHDPFRIAAITALDANGIPAAFGAVKTCSGGNGSNNNGSWGHPSTTSGNRQFAAYVMRKDAAESRLRVSSNVNQEVGGVFYTFSDLDITAGKTLYGYVLLSSDGTALPGSAQLLNLNNTAIYPTQTNESAGGLDLVAVNTVFATGSNIVLPLKIGSFTGSWQDGSPLLHWQLENKDDNDKVSLERSTDGVSWSSVTSLQGLTGEYADRNAPGAATPTLSYRLQILSASGTISYSRIITLHDPQTGAAWRIYPTMLTPGQPLRLQGLPDGHYTVLIYDLNGTRRPIDISVLNKETRVPQPPGGLIPGLYWLKIQGVNGVRAFTVRP